MDVCATNFVKNMSVRLSLLSPCSQECQHCGCINVNTSTIQCSPLPGRLLYHLICTSSLSNFIPLSVLCFSSNVHVFAHFFHLTWNSQSLTNCVLHIQDITSYLLVYFNPTGGRRTLLLLLVVTRYPEVCFNKTNTASAYVW